MIISSRDNPVFKRLKKVRHKGIKTGSVILEGNNSLAQLIEYQYPYQLILRGEEYPELEGIRLVEGLFKELASTEQSQGILMEIKPKEKHHMHGNILYLEQMSDPGNLGTILRSASAFGLDTICLGPGSVSLYNDKVLRSSLTAFLSLNVIEQVSLQSIRELEGYHFYGAELQGEAFYQLKPKDPWVLFLGNEAHGLSPEALDLIHQAVTIPMKGTMESLNASVAASILLESFLRKP